MEWHYADGGKQVGPVPEADFNQLVNSGRITPDTPVWREGMPNWQPYRALQIATVPPAPAQPLMPPPPPGAAPPVMSGPTASCVECGYLLPTGEMIAYGETWVCARCKPVFFQRIREGAPLAAGNATVWRSGDSVVIASGTALPDRCAKCNGAVTRPPIKRTLYWHAPWIYILILVSLLIYLVVALIVRKKALAAIPLCDEHRSKRGTVILVSWLLVVAGIIGIIVGIGNESGLFGGLGALGLLAGLVLGVWKGTLVSTKRIDGEYVWIRGFCKDYLEKLPEFPGGR